MFAYSTPDRLSGFMEITTPTGIQLTAMQALINAVSANIDKYTSRTFHKTTYNALELDTERGQTINLPYYPIDLTQSFILERRSSQLNEDKWQTIDGLYYEVDADTGIIHFMDGVYVFRGKRIYRATFTAGYDFDNASTFLSDTDAADVELALWLEAKDIWLKKKTPGDLYSEKIGDYAITYQRNTKGSTGFGIQNDQARDILEKYVDNSPVGVLTPLQSVGV